MERGELSIHLACPLTRGVDGTARGLEYGDEPLEFLAGDRMCWPSPSSQRLVRPRITPTSGVPTETYHIRGIAAGTCCAARSPMRPSGKISEKPRPTSPGVQGVILRSLACVVFQHRTADLNQKRLNSDSRAGPDERVINPPRGASTEEQDLNRLLPLVYDELKRLAHLRLMAEPAGHTLNTTGLVHEAFLRLSEQSDGRWRDRTHFLALASIAMRRILIDYARRHRSIKRGGEQSRVPLDATNLAVDERAETLIELDDALTKLAHVDPQLSRVVECRFFGGMTEEETARALGVTSRTVRNRWTTAKGLLYLELSAP